MTDLEDPALDAHWTTASLVETLVNHIYEGLYSLDDNYQPIPMLAEGMPAVSRDQLTYTIKLRRGVKFHNGKEMTAEDVVPSLNRWGQQSPYGRALYAQVAEVRAPDKHTVEIKLREKSGIVVISLAVPNAFAAIYPKEIAEKFKPAEKTTEQHASTSVSSSASPAGTPARGDVGNGRFRYTLPCSAHHSLLHRWR